MRLLVILFVAIPIIEMWVLIEVGAKIGALTTILLVVLTASIGLALLRQQGVSTLLRLNQRMEQGQIPAREIFEGVMLAVGGALLLTPGFITDAFGFACLIPQSRKAMISGLLRHGVVMSGYGRAAKSDGPFQETEQRTEFFSATLKAKEHDRTATEIEGDYRRED